MQEPSNNKPRIITKKTNLVKQHVFSWFGGITIKDFFVFGFFIMLCVLTLTFLTPISIIASGSLAVILFLLAILLIQPYMDTGLKFYQFIWMRFLFIFIKDKNNEPLLISDVNAIHKNVIVFNNQKQALCFAINAIDLTIANQTERNNPIMQLRNLLQALNYEMEFIKTDITYDFSQNINWLSNLKSHSLDASRVALIDSYISQLQSGGASASINNKIYLLIYVPSIQQVSEITNILVSLNSQYLQLQPTDEAQTSYLFLKKVFPNFTENSSKPSKISQTKNYLKINNSYFSYLTIREYPLLVNDLWLSDLFALPNIDIYLKCIDIDYLKANKIIDKVSNIARYSTSNKQSDNVQMQSYLEQFYTLQQMVIESGEKLKYVSLIFTITADTKKDLLIAKNKLAGLIASKGFKVNKLHYFQKSTYLFLLNKLRKQDNLLQEMCTTTLASSWFFNQDALQDPHGLLLGDAFVANKVSPIFFDPLFFSQHRLSGNIIINGTTGYGKSFLTKKIMNHLLVRNTKLIVFDWQNEYRHFAQAFNAKIININEPSSIINPLQVINHSLQTHIDWICEWFTILFPELSDIQLLDLQTQLSSLYQQFNITNDNWTTIQNEDWPILTNLYLLSKLNPSLDDKLLKILDSLANGNYCRLFNSHTRINLDFDFIIFNLQHLANNYVDKIRTAQFYTLLNFIDKLVVTNKSYNDNLKANHQTNFRYLVLVFDEAHYFMKSSNLACLKYLDVLCRTIRKCYGLTIITTQHIKDLVKSTNNEISDLTSNLINDSIYHFILHLNPDDFDAFNDYLDSAGRLNAIQKNFVINAEPGQCLFTIAGTQRYLLNINSCDWENELCTLT